jgi:C4-dicarboxylate-specific signal transduction histidine kinase
MPEPKKRPAKKPLPAGGGPNHPAQQSLPDEVRLKLWHGGRSRLLSKLAAPAAHEIINPVSAALNLAAIMHSGLKEDRISADRAKEFRGYLAQIISESTRAGRIASELLALARASYREPRLADFNEIVAGAFSVSAHRFKIEDVECTLALAQHLPPVRCDAVRMQEVVLNLLANALEAVAGRAERRVQIMTRRREDARGVVLEIADSGPGVPRKHMSKIFDPWFTTSDRPENLGLGLTVARSIVETCGGFLELAGEQQAGATFRVTLPAEDGR